MPTLPYESAFLASAARRFVEALAGSGACVLYVGGADSLSSVRHVLALGCAAVQLGRPLLREPWFVRKLEAAAVADADRDGGGGGDGGVVDIASTCIRCNRCTLASIDPLKFASGCLLLTDQEEAEWEAQSTARLRDLEDLGARRRRRS